MTLEQNFEVAELGLSVTTKKNQKRQNEITQICIGITYFAWFDFSTLR